MTERHKPKHNQDFVLIQAVMKFFVCLQEEFRNTLANNMWHKKLEFAGGETIVMHSPQVIVHFRPTSQPDEWGTTQVGTVHRAGSNTLCFLSPTNSNRVATGQGKVREIQDQGKVREF